MTERGKGESMMRRFIIGMLILGGIIAAVAFVMKRRSASDAGWDEFAQDSYSKVSDAATRGSQAAKDAATQVKEAAKDAAAQAKEAAKRAPDKAKKLADQATEAVVDISDEVQRSTS
jgi:gas vesicle protein